MDGFKLILGPTERSRWYGQLYSGTKPHFEPGDDTIRKIEYSDNDLPENELELVDTLRSQLQDYNELLKRTFIDIPSYQLSTFTRIINKGRDKGRKQVISLDPRDKFVVRVFNEGLQGNWQRGGRFYRGCWQQIDKEDRSKIYINDKPTMEVDFTKLSHWR